MADPTSSPVPKPLSEELSRERERAESLLPWAATGALSEADRVWLDEWLAATERTHPEIVLPLRSELSWLKRTASNVQTNVTLPDPEQGLGSLLGRIADERASAREASSQLPSSAIGLWGRLRAWALGHGPQLAGACAVLVIAQATTLVLLDRSGSDLDPLSGGTGVTDVKGTVLLKVAFSPRASEGDIRQVLLAAQARIVDGPSALGLYLLRVRLEDSDNAVKVLTNQPRVVESVQPVK